MKIHSHAAPLLAAVAAILTATTAAAAPFKIVDVDCAAGDSIQRALARKDTELVINVRGMCVEDVVVARDRVTLRGANPARDGIRAATTSDPFGAALFVRGARYVNLENLTITGGRYAGLLIEDTRRNVYVRNCRIEGNQQSGMLVANGLATASDLWVTGNGVVGVAASETGLLTCDDCVIADNPGPGAGLGMLVTGSSLVRLNRGSIAARFPLSVRFNAFAVVKGTTLDGSVAVDASSGAEISIRGSDVSGSLRADGASRVQLIDTRQLTNPLAGGNVAAGGSTLTAGPLVTLIGETALDEFSEGVFNTATELDDLRCASGSVAVCAPGVVKKSSTCSSCP